jgi:MFS family permease
VRELLRLPGLGAVMLASVITVTAADLITIYLPLLGAERSIDMNDIGGLLTARAFASMTARLIYARLIVGFGRVALMVASLLGAAAAFAALAVPMPVALLYAATASTGFTIGIATTITVTTIVAMTAAGARATVDHDRTSLSPRLTVTTGPALDTSPNLMRRSGVRTVILLRLAHRRDAGRHPHGRLPAANLLPRSPFVNPD